MDKKQDPYKVQLADENPELDKLVKAWIFSSK